MSHSSEVHYAATRIVRFGGHGPGRRGICTVFQCEVPIHLTRPRIERCIRRRAYHDSPRGSNQQTLSAGGPNARGGWINKRKTFGRSAPVGRPEDIGVHTAHTFCPGGDGYCESEAGISRFALGTQRIVLVQLYSGSGCGNAAGESKDGVGYAEGCPGARASFVRVAGLGEASAMHGHACCRPFSCI